MDCVGFDSMMGDINLDANTWKDDGFLLKSIASPLFEGLEECLNPWEKSKRAFDQWVG